MGMGPERGHRREASRRREVPPLRLRTGSHQGACSEAPHRRQAGARRCGRDLAVKPVHRRDVWVARMCQTRRAPRSTTRGQSHDQRGDLEQESVARTRVAELWLPVCAVGGRFVPRSVQTSTEKDLAWGVTAEPDSVWFPHTPSGRSIFQPHPRRCLMRMSLAAMAVLGLVASTGDVGFGQSGPAAALSIEGVWKGLTAVTTGANASSNLNRHEGPSRGSSE